MNQEQILHAKNLEIEELKKESNYMAQMYSWVTNESGYVGYNTTVDAHADKWSNGHNLNWQPK